MECFACKLASPQCRLRVVRKLLGIDRITMYRFLGVGSTTYYMWEHKAVEFRHKQMELLNHVGISSKWILYGDGVPFIRSAEKSRELIIEELQKRVEDEQ